MNLTNTISTWCKEKSKDKAEALEFFRKVYPDIVYEADTDSYLYRGYRFDYFKSGIPLSSHGSDFYLLVYHDDNKIWLFNYGHDREYNWNEFLKAVSHSEFLKSVGYATTIKKKSFMDYLKSIWRNKN